MPKTYNDIYFSVRKQLKESGIEAFALEARILVAAAAGKTTEQLMCDLGLYTSDAIEKNAMQMLARRLKGEPLAYIAGTWEFYGLPMTVTPDVLIPRMDTEVLVDAALEVIRSKSMNVRALDLCCGSGCIACAIAKKMPPIRVVAADISLPALEVCRRNVSENGLSGRVITMNADASTWPPMSIGSFDLIVSNPPYIATSELLGLDGSVRDYEPLGALDGGEDGLDFYRAIIKYWTIILRPDARVIFEVGEGQADAVKEMMLHSGFVSVSSKFDTLGVERVIIGQWKNEY